MTNFLAAVFHDIVYNPKSNTNEEDSANLFISESKNFSYFRPKRAHQTINFATKSHKPTVKYSGRVYCC
ncbi:MAG: hypothetical protein IPJ32_06325 [Sphingobacteriaceae bacterium]|nr:hypothetical protein [Sphingobacteriaceae bacterium]